MEVDGAEVNQELQKYASNYYRDHFRRAAKLLFFFIILNLILTVIAGYLYYRTPKEPSQYFTSNIVTGEITPLYPLSAPISAATLSESAKSLLFSLYNFNFVNYNELFTGLQASFSSDAWQQFNNSIQALLTQVTNQQLFVSAAVSTPVILDPLGTLSNGIRSNRVRIAVKLSYKDNNSQPVTVEPQLIFVDLTLSRSADIDKTDGIVVSSYKVTTAK